MYRGTTPTICFSLISSIDMADAIGIWLTFSMFNRSLTFTKGRVTVDAPERKMYVTLTQQETLSLGTGTVKVQARILMRDGTAYATDVSDVEVLGVLMDGEICDGADDSDEGAGDGTGGSDESGEAGTPGSEA